MNRMLTVTATLAILLTSGAAFAHHGWSWAQADQIELTGTIRTISFAPPHPTLDITTADGEWHIELGNPGLTQRSGFVEGVTKVGEEVTVLGNRSLDPKEKRLKAVRVTLAGKAFDIYPDRIRTN